MGDGEKICLECGNDAPGSQNASSPARRKQQGKRGWEFGGWEFDRTQVGLIAGGAVLCLGLVIALAVGMSGGNDRPQLAQSKEPAPIVPAPNSVSLTPAPAVTRPLAPPEEKPETPPEDPPVVESPVVESPAPAPIPQESTPEAPATAPAPPSPEQPLVESPLPAGDLLPPEASGPKPLKMPAGFEGWLQDLELAKRQAAKEKKDIVIVFSGSDWCGYCIKLKDEVLKQPDFQTLANRKFVFVLIDFPRGSEAQAFVQDPKRNGGLAQQFEVRGLPHVVLTDARGKPYGVSGYLSMGPEEYLAHLTELKSKGKRR